MDFRYSLGCAKVTLFPTSNKPKPNYYRPEAVIFPNNQYFCKRLYKT